MNPQKIAILADSCCDIPAKQTAETDLFLVPLRILAPDGEYADGVDIFASDIYRRLADGENLSTSLPVGASVEQVLNAIKTQGYEKVIALMLSSGLSGTYNLLRLTAENYDGLEIIVFDSKSGSLGSGMMIYQLLEDLKQGMGWEQLIGQRVPQLIHNTFPFFSVDTLEYLQKGHHAEYQTRSYLCRRRSTENVAKVRGMKQIQQKYIDTLTAIKGDCKRFNLAIANGAAPKQMESLRTQMEEAFPGYDHFWEGEIGATLSSYIGPGVLGAAITLLDE